MKIITNRNLFKRENQKEIYNVFYELVLSVSLAFCFSFISLFLPCSSGALFQFPIMLYAPLSLVMAGGLLLRRILSPWAKELLLVWASLVILGALLSPLEGFGYREGRPVLFLVNRILLFADFLIISSGGIIKIYHTNVRSRQTDPLTDMGNERWMSLYVNRHIRGGAGKAFLMLVNVKNFRLINAIYGRSFGDELILSVAEHLEKGHPSQAKLAHLSGMEFCLWVEDPDKVKSAQAFDKLRNEFLCLVRETGKAVNPVLLTSGAVYPDDGVNFQQLYSRANMAMERIIVLGNSAPVFYTEKIEEELRMENIYAYELQKAVESRAFSINYQAKYDISGTVLHGFEALARWKSPALGDVSPDVFIPLVHSFGLTVPFTEMIIEKVFGDIEEISLNYGDDVQVSLNIPPLYIHHPRAFSFFKMILLESGIDPKRIILEITEDLSIEGMEAVRRLEQLRNLGMKISLDDFGTGFSSLSYLLSLPIHELKIDKSFIDTIENSDRSYRLVKSICDIARINDCTIVAEGVETKEQVELLKRTSCNLIQGYVYSKPCDILEGKGLLEVDEVG